MALKAVITAAEHGALQEGWRAFYKQDGDRYVLDLEGTDDHPSVKGLKGALDGERRDRAAKEREMADLKAKIGDLDPDAARAALARVKELEGQLKEGDIPKQFEKQFNEAVEHRVQALRADFENKEKSYQKQLKEREDNLGSLNTRLEELVIDNAVRDAAAKAGLHDWAIEDAVMHARAVYRLKDGKPVPIRPGTKDEIIYGKDAGQPKPIAEWLGDKIAEKPGWVKSSAGGGAGGGGNGAAGNGQFRLTREQARDTGLYRKTREAAEKAGQTIQIVD